MLGRPYAAHRCSLGPGQSPSQAPSSEEGAAGQPGPCDMTISNGVSAATRGWGSSHRGVACGLLISRAAPSSHPSSRLLQRIWEGDRPVDR